MRNKDSIERVATDLEIDEQLDLHTTGWKAQRIGLAFMFLLVLLAAIGLFGDGLLSKSKFSEHNIAIESQRFFRYEARMPLKIKVENNAASETTVSFPNYYLDELEIESIIPEPYANNFLNDQVQYVFKGGGNINITFYLVPQNFGKLEGSVTVNDQPFLLNHFIFP